MSKVNPLVALAIGSASAAATTMLANVVAGKDPFEYDVLESAFLSAASGALSLGVQKVKELSVAQSRREGYESGMAARAAARSAAHGGGGGGLFAVLLQLGIVAQEITDPMSGAVLSPEMVAANLKSAAMAAAAGALLTGGLVVGSMSLPYLALEEPSVLAAEAGGAGAGVAKLPDWMSAVGSMDGRSLQTAQQMAGDTGNFMDDLGALAQSVSQHIPAGQINLIGELNGSPIWGSLVSRVGIVSINGATTVVSAPIDQAVQILGPFHQ